MLIILCELWTGSEMLHATLQLSPVAYEGRLSGTAFVGIDGDGEEIRFSCRPVVGTTLAKDVVIFCRETIADEVEDHAGPESLGVLTDDKMLIDGLLDGTYDDRAELLRGLPGGPECFNAPEYVPFAAAFGVGPGALDDM